MLALQQLLDCMPNHSHVMHEEFKRTGFIDAIKSCAKDVLAEGRRCKIFNSKDEALLDGIENNPSFIEAMKSCAQDVLAEERRGKIFNSEYSKVEEWLDGIEKNPSEKNHPSQEAIYQLLALAIYQLLALIEKYPALCEAFFYNEESKKHGFFSKEFAFYYHVYCGPSGQEKLKFLDWGQQVRAALKDKGKLEGLVKPILPSPPLKRRKRQLLLECELLFKAALKLLINELGCQLPGLLPLALQTLKDDIGSQSLSRVFLDLLCIVYQNRLHNEVIFNDLMQKIFIDEYVPHNMIFKSNAKLLDDVCCYRTFSVKGESVFYKTGLFQFLGWNKFPRNFFGPQNKELWSFVERSFVERQASIKMSAKPASQPARVKDSAFFSVGSPATRGFVPRCGSLKEGGAPKENGALDNEESKQPDIGIQKKGAWKPSEGEPGASDALSPKGKHESKAKVASDGKKSEEPSSAKGEKRRRGALQKSESLKVKKIRVRERSKC